MKYIFLIIAFFVGMGVIAISPTAHAAIGFVEPGVSSDTPGLISGLWHGMVAPYALLLSLFRDVEMYAHPNMGFSYDAGFLLGVAGSLPGGWVLAIISLLMLVM